MHANSYARTRATGALALSLVSGCAQGGATGSSANTVTYWLWDANQLPAYQACAKGFEKENPGLKVKITQLGWSDYWTKLTAGFIAGTAPDVFTDHIQNFGQFADLKVLEPLDDLGIEDSDYQPGLAANWVGQDGHRYGAPKDWDTVALFYNQKMAKDAGLTAEQLDDLSWNPKDGGTFEKAIAHLTVDRNGKRGDEPGFDKNNVKVYGLATGGGGFGDGQTQWSTFAASAGWSYLDKPRWGTKYQYDSKTFQSVVKWYFGLAKKGYMPPLSDYNVQSNQANTQVAAGKAATAFDGAWMISTYAGFKGLDIKTARDADRPDRQARHHDERPRRLHHQGLQEQGGRPQVGGVSGLGRVPDRGRQVRGRLPRHSGRDRGRRRRVPEEGHRRLGLHRTRGRQEALPDLLVSDRQLLGGHDGAHGSPRWRTSTATESP